MQRGLFSQLEIDGDIFIAIESSLDIVGVIVPSDVQGKTIVVDVATGGLPLRVIGGLA
jgi:hypothetical protein